MQPEAKVLWVAIFVWLGWVATSGNPSCKEINPSFTCTRYVSHSGNDSNDCKTVQTACKTTDAAIEKANPTGDGICVDGSTPGTYVMGSTTSKSIVMKSINGTATISCSSPFKRAIEATGGAGSYFILDGLKFVTCGAGAVAFNSVAKVFVRNCTFDGNIGANGGALLIGPDRDAESLVCNSLFKNNIAWGNGGAIALFPGSGKTFTSNNILVVEGSSFESNIAEKGDAFYVSNGNQVMSDFNLVFVGNRFYFDGHGNTSAGGIVVEAQPGWLGSQDWTFNFTRNTFSSRFYGVRSEGAVHFWMRSSVQGVLYWFEDNTFSDNEATTTGGAINVEGQLQIPGHRLVVKGGSFQRNQATEQGGAISIQGYYQLESLTLDGVSFQKNSALNVGGGGIAVTGVQVTGKVTISNCTFISNESPGGDGGAILMQPGSLSAFILQNSTFVANSVLRGSGGALATTVEEVSILGSTFKGNSGFAGAGAIWLQNPRSMELRSSQFTENKGIGGSLFGGGGISISHNLATTIGASHAIKENSFEQNLANGGGGAISIQHLNCSELVGNTYDFENNTFLNNRVNPYGSGAAIAWFNFPPLFYNSVVNNTLGFSENHYHGNLAPSGGAVAINYEMVSPYSQQREATVTLSYGNVHYFMFEEMENNTAVQGNGGGMSIQFPVAAAGVSDGRNHIKGAIFANNSASCTECFGGGLHLVKGFSEIDQVSFVGNNANGPGSSIGVEGSNTSLAVSNSIFMNNVEGDVDSSSTGLLSFDNRTYFIENGEPAIVIRSAGPVHFPPDDNVDCHELLRSRQGSLMQCTPCPNDTYWLHPEGQGNDEKTLECHDCPGEAECLGGSDVLVRPGYWCGISASDPTALECIECPEGYCKDETTFFNETCVGHRTGLLCGGCAPGYSEAFGTDDCKPTSECDTSANAWLFLAVIGFGLCYIFLLLKFPVNHHPLWKSVVYFMQVVPLIIGAPNTVLQGLFAAFALEFSLFGLSWSVCPWPDMTAVQKIASDYYLPLILLTLLGLVLLCHIMVSTAWKKGFSFAKYLIDRWRKWRAGSDGLEIEDSSVYGLGPFLEEPEEPPYMPLPPEPVSSHEEHEDDEHEEHRVLVGYSVYAAALTGLFLLMYEGATAATMELLSCSSVHGDLHIFRGAEQECYTVWQYPLFLLLLLLVVVPLMLPFMCSLLEKRWPSSLYTYAVLEVLQASYRKSRRWWEAVGLLRRLLLLSFSTFILNPVARALAIFTSSLVILLSHLFFKPHANQYYGWVESAFLSNLCLLAALAIPKAVYVFLGLSYRDTLMANAISWTAAVLVMLPLGWCALVLLFHLYIRYMPLLKQKSTQALQLQDE